MKREGWLKDHKKNWSMMFDLDKTSWVKQQFVFIHQGRTMPGNEPPLLKSRQRMIKDDAIRLWGQLQKEASRFYLQFW